MRHEKIFKRENGTQYRISINFDCLYGRIAYRVDVVWRAKRKRNWGSIERIISGWDYRALSMDEREKCDDREYLRFVTKEEIQQTKLELWELLKPLEVK